MKYTQELDTALADTIKIGSIQPRLHARSSLKLPKLLDAVCILLPLLAFFLWAISLQHVSVYDMNDLGLITVLSPKIIAALVILMFSFVLTLQQPQMRVSVLALHVVLIIIILYGTENLIEEATRFAVVYRHAGYTEYITRTGTVDPNLDAYFSWPGFFVLSAFVTRIAGYQTILSFAGWAPVFFNLIYFGPLYMIFTSFTSNRRLVWLSIWFFYLTNWIAQDYFSPQGLNFFLYMVIIAILLKWFKIPLQAKLHEKQGWQTPERFSLSVAWFLSWLRAPDALFFTVHPWQRRALFASLIVVFGLVVFSHPLTPFFVLISVTALVLFRRSYPFWLPILMAVMLGAWFYFMTQDFLAGHSSMVLGNLGDIGSNVSSSVTSRAAKGDAQHQLIAFIRIVMTGFIWVLALIGGIRRLLKGCHDLTYILLAAVPFPIIIAQDYGGEMFLRVYLFTLPFMVLFAAALFYSKHSLVARKTSPLMTFALVAINLVLLGGFFFTRYGNEHVDYMTYGEINSLHYLYKVAPPKSVLIEAWNDTPWQFQDFEKYTCLSFSDTIPNAVIDTNVGAVVRFINSQDNPHVYVVFTRGQETQAYSASGVPIGAMERLENAMLKSGEFKQIYTNRDAQIFAFLGNTKGGG